MSDENNSGWISQGTPRDDEWDVEPDEYGTAVEWDDHATEQSVPVAPPRPRPTPAPAEEAEEPTQVVRTGTEFTPPPVPSEPVAAETESPADEPTGEVSGASAAADLPGSEETKPLATTDDSSRIDSPEHLAWLRLANPPSEPEHETPPVAAPDAAPQSPPPGAPAEAEAEGIPSTTVAQPDDAGAQPMDQLPGETAAEPAADPVQASDHADSRRSAYGSQPDAIEPKERWVEVSPQRADDSAFDDESDDEVVAAQPVDPPVEEPPQAAAPVEDAPESVDNPYASDAAVGWEPAEEPAAPAVPADLYRTGEQAQATDQPAAASPEAEAAPQQPDVADVEAEEEARVAAQLAAERAARAARLGQVSTSTENEVRTLPKPQRRVTDKPLGALALLFIRLVTAANLGVVSYKILTDIDATTEYLARTVLPEPRLVAWILGFTLGTMAVLLVIGLLQRVVGFLLFALGIGSLIVLRWGSFNPFAGQEAFAGDKDLLLVAIGFLLLALGGGKISIDGAVRSHWQKSRSKESD